MNEEKYLASPDRFFEGDGSVRGLGVCGNEKRIE